jgi:hypothetical protein
MLASEEFKKMPCGIVRVRKPIDQLKISTGDTHGQRQTSNAWLRGEVRI